MRESKWKWTKAANGRRSFPGRLTLEEWQAVPLSKCIELIRRSHCDLLGSFRRCGDKSYRRHRTCCGADSESCRRRLSRLIKPQPKTLRSEWARLDALQRI